MIKKYQNKIMPLTETELGAMSSILWCKLRTLRRLYARYGLDAMAVIALENVYFLSSKTEFGRMRDMLRIADVYYPEKGHEILKSLFDFGLYHADDSGWITTPGRLMMIRRMCTHSDFPLCPSNMSSGGGRMIYPKDKLINRPFMHARLKEMLRLIDLTPRVDVKKDVKGGDITRACFNINDFYTMVTFVLGMDKSFTMFRDVFDSAVTFLGLDAGMVYSVFADSGYLVYDNERGIVYNAIGRVKNGLKESPTDKEIKCMYEDVLNRYINLDL